MQPLDALDVAAIDALLTALRCAADLADGGHHALSRRIVDAVVDVIVGAPP